MLGWWGWLWWFARQCRDRENLYSWVHVQLKRDGFSITFSLLTLLSAAILLWAYHSRLPMWKRIAACCCFIVGGIIIPFLAGAFLLIGDMGFPAGWPQDLGRLVFLMVTPVVFLLTVIAVLWRHRSRPRLLVYYLGFAWLVGWLLIPLILAGSLKRAFHHFTHPEFDGVLLTVLSMAIVLIASWWIKNQKCKLWVFCLAGLIAGPGIYLKRLTDKTDQPRLPVVYSPDAIQTTEVLVPVSDQRINGHRELRFDTRKIRNLPDAAVDSKSVVIHQISEVAAKSDQSISLSRLKPYLTMGWDQPLDTGFRHTWRVQLDLPDNGGPGYAGRMKIEGEFRGLRRRPFISLPAGKPGQVLLPGSRFFVTLHPRSENIKHAQARWSLKRIQWSPHGALARDSRRLDADPYDARPDWTISFSPAPPRPFTFHFYSRMGQFRAFYSESDLSCTMRWELFDAEEYKILTHTDRARLRVERLNEWERWLNMATMTLYESVEEIVFPFCLEAEVPLIKPTP